MMEADMRRFVLTVPVAAVALLAWFAYEATAQPTKTSRGTVTALTGDMLTVKTDGQEMKFAVDAKTRVIAEGGSTASRQAEATGKAGPKLSDLIQVGNAVEVTYTESGGTMRATGIRRVADAGRPGGTAKDSDTVDATVDSISGNTLTISGTMGRDASFKQSITVDESTKIVAAGAGTAAAKSGGKLVLSDHLGPGDRVTVTYETKGTMVHATEIRVRQRVKK
jgi:hypothetical protein